MLRSSCFPGLDSHRHTRLQVLSKWNHFASRSCSRRLFWIVMWQAVSFLQWWQEILVHVVKLQQNVNKQAGMGESRIRFCRFFNNLEGQHPFPMESTCVLAVHSSWIIVYMFSNKKWTHQCLLVMSYWMFFGDHTNFEHSVLTAVSMLWC